MIYGPNHDPKFMLQAALKGLAAAHGRFNAQSAARVGAEEVFIPLSEALWWTVTVNDGFESLADNGPDYRPNRDDYRNARDSDADGQALRALRYARDRCGHQRALVAGVKLPTLPATIPMVLGPVFCWRPSADLPSPDLRFNSPALQGEYDKLLAGRPAAGALGSARRWFDRERVRAGL
jgi:hypothetical protein